MKIVKIAIVVIVIVIIGALVFAYMKVAHNVKPVAMPPEDQSRIKLEQKIQSMSQDVDPKDRKDLENLIGKRFPSAPATKAN